MSLLKYLINNEYFNEENISILVKININLIVMILKFFSKKSST